MAFFGQKHGLTPMEKSDFWDFQKVFFFIVKKDFFKAKKGLFFLLKVTKHYL